MKNLKTIISVLVLSFLITSPLMAKSLTLWEYYDRQGLSLPSISERAEIYAKINPYELYTGTLTQNIPLLDFIQLAPESTEKTTIEETFGGVGGSSELPQVSADFESSLVSRINPSDTEMTLVDSTDRDGTTLSGWYGFSIEADSSKKEYVIANCTGSSCSQMLRGVSFDNGVATSSARAFIHGRGTDISITNHPNLTIITNILNGTDGIPDKIYYDDTVTISAGDDQKTLTDLQYVNNLIASGVATTTQSIFGGGTEATQSQIAEGYYDINDPRLITTRYASSTPTVATTTVPVTGTDGKLDQGFLDLTEEWTFLATTTSATSTAVHGDFTTLSVDSLEVPYSTASSSAASVGYVDSNITSKATLTQRPIGSASSCSFNSSSWTDCDLSSVVGAKATLVIAKIQLTGSASGVAVRRNGDTYDYSALLENTGTNRIYNSGGSITFQGLVMVTTDEDGIIEGYRLGSEGTATFIIIDYIN